MYLLKKCNKKFCTLLRPYFSRRPAPNEDADCIVYSFSILLCSVAELRHFYAAPAPGKNFDAAPAPTKL
jgi:hypothetical protein